MRPHVRIENLQHATNVGMETIFAAIYRHDAECAGISKLFTVNPNDQLGCGLCGKEFPIYAS